ncbi:MAG: NINE protein [Propionicimonas sp.]
MTAPPGSWGPPPPPPNLPPGQPLSKKRAVLLAFFLGAFGAHNFYLNQRKRGFGHLLLLGLALLGFLAMGIYTLFIVFWYSDLYLGHELDDAAQALTTFLLVLPFALIVADLVWAIIEGFVILASPLE